MAQNLILESLKDESLEMKALPVEYKLQLGISNWLSSIYNAAKDEFIALTLENKELDQGYKEAANQLSSCTISTDPQKIYKNLASSTPGSYALLATKSELSIYIVSFHLTTKLNYNCQIGDGRVIQDFVKHTVSFLDDLDVHHQPNACDPFAYIMPLVKDLNNNPLAEFDVTAFWQKYCTNTEQQKLLPTPVVTSQEPVDIELCRPSDQPPVVTAEPCKPCHQLPAVIQPEQNHDGVAKAAFYTACAIAAVYVIYKAAKYCFKPTAIGGLGAGFGGGDNGDGAGDDGAMPDAQVYFTPAGEHITHDATGEGEVFFRYSARAQPHLTHSPIAAEEDAQYISPAPVVRHRAPKMTAQKLAIMEAKHLLEKSPLVARHVHDEILLGGEDSDFNDSE